MHKIKNLICSIHNYVTTKFFITPSIDKQATEHLLQERNDCDVLNKQERYCNCDK
jgi:hypothetical protein